MRVLSRMISRSMPPHARPKVVSKFHATWEGTAENSANRPLERNLRLWGAQATLAPLNRSKSPKEYRRFVMEYKIDEDTRNKLQTYLLE